MGASGYQIKVLAESNQTLGVVMSEVLDALYGEEWLGWDPLTVALELMDDFRADVSPETMDRVCAAQLLRTTDEFYTRPDAFAGMANSLASGSPAFDVFDPPSAPEVAWALTEAAMLRPSAELSADVRGMVEASMAEAGFDGSAIPSMVAAALGPRPESDAVVGGAVDMSLRDMSMGALEEFIDERMALLTAQLDSVAELTGGADSLSAKLRRMSLANTL